MGLVVPLATCFVDGKLAFRKADQICKLWSYSCLPKPSPYYTSPDFVW